MPLVAIAGLGVIGGSLAKALKNAGVTVRAYSPLRAERERARAEQIACEDTLGPELVRDATAVVIAVPLDRIAAVARTLRPHVPDGCIVLHTGSLQSPHALNLRGGESEWLIGAHPLAGSAHSGFEHSTAELFTDATVCVESRVGAAERSIIQMLWRKAGASSLIWRDAEEHDRLMSWVSHLPQLGATALALALLRADIGPSSGGPALRDMTRLASSSLMMWRPLLDAAPADTLEALRALEQAVKELRSALEEGDQELLSEMWTAARAWRMNAEQPNAG